jgi:EpsI family protein
MIRRLAIVAGVLVLLSVWTHARPHPIDVSRFDFARALPLAFRQWIGRDAPPLDPAVAKVLAADQYVHRYYGSTNDDRAPRIANRIADRGSRIADIEIDIAYYAQPQAGAAMHSPLNCLPGNGWQVMQSRVMPVTIDRQAVGIRELVVSRGPDRLAMTYWFQNRGAVIGNEYAQRYQLLTNGLQGRPTDAALVRVMALDTSQGHTALGQFTRELASLLAAAFR